MFKDFMARLGHGAAKVDLILEQNRFAPGDPVAGKVLIKGGSVEQRINKIDVRFMLSIYAKGHVHTHPVASVPFYQSFVIRPGEQKELPFHFQLPGNLLVTGQSVSYYFDTQLDLAGAVDQSDRDYIEIVPPVPLSNILAALSRLGFRETHHSRKFNGYVQEFELVPTELFREQVKEVEFAAAIEPNGVRLLLEVEYYSFGHHHEVKREVFIPQDQISDPDALMMLWQNLITESMSTPHYGHGHYHIPHSYHHGQSHYGHSHHHHGHDHHHHSHLSGMTGAIGGFAAGLIGGVLLDELLDGDDNQNHDAGLFGNNDNGGFFDDGDDGGFFGGGDDDNWV
ncbi:sporulation protein [Thermoactinomyces sp. CICC 10523]|jgi:sporulation-control protein|uniref:sporulation protein n=1 Tax=Thermoactinomyces sp. CICC 10523 TaxID=2767428 RepID=UPI0018DBDA9E|nr:sporulation protein [Thermoactinomyces sp. CICC 10523]MBH8596550.1 sporulation protein [Thermoactinomyces sp. CICC 10523]